MVIAHRTRFSATAVLCGVSVFVYPAIAWGACAPATVNTGGATLVSDQLLEQLRQRREQQATVSMFSTAGSSVVNVSTAPTATTASATTTATAAAAAPASKPRAKAAAKKVTTARRFQTRRAENYRGAGRSSGMLKRRPSQGPAQASATESLWCVRLSGRRVLFKGCSNRQRSAKWRLGCCLRRI